MRLVLLISALICAGCVRDRGPGPEDQKSKLLPFGLIDVPTAGQSVSGPLNIGGWAIHESGIRSVQIFIDRKYTADGNIGLSRPDVALLYPAFQREMISGWSALIDTTQLSPEFHEFVVKIYAKNGAMRDLSVSVVVTKPR